MLTREIKRLGHFVFYLLNIIMFYNPSIAASLVKSFWDLILVWKYHIISLFLYLFRIKTITKASIWCCSRLVMQHEVFKSFRFSFASSNFGVTELRSETSSVHRCILDQRQIVFPILMIETFTLQFPSQIIKMEETVFDSHAWSRMSLVLSLPQAAK